MKNVPWNQIEGKAQTALNHATEWCEKMSVENEFKDKCISELEMLELSGQLDETTMKSVSYVYNKDFSLSLVIRTTRFNTKPLHRIH